MKWAIATMVIAVGIALLDRALLRAEARGWIFYRRRKPGSSSASNALLSLQAIFEPEKEHVVVERREMELDEADSGDPREPGRAVDA